MSSKPLSRKGVKPSDTPNPPATRRPVARARKAVAAGAAAEAVATAARAAEEHVVQPVAAAVGLAVPPKPKHPEKVKRPRYVRGPAEERGAAKAAPLPARSTTAAGKMMSKKLSAAPPAAGSAGTQRGPTVSKTGRKPKE